MEITKAGSSPLANASRHARFRWHREGDFASFNEEGTTCHFHGEVKASGALFVSGKSTNVDAAVRLPGDEVISLSFVGR
jgi:hypothetical protein